MKRAHFYLFALWLPLICLVLISLGETILKRYGWHYSDVSGYVLISGAMAGIQYLLFAAAVTWRFANVDTAFMSRLSWVMPVMFFPVCTIGLWIFFMAVSINASREYVRTTDIDLADTILGFCLRFGTYTVMAGYLYVIMLHGLMFVLSKLGLLEYEGDTTWIK